MEKEEGAWVPWPLALALLRLRLGPSSRWQVFLAVLLVWCRYGRREAWLSIADISKITGLKKRTVKAALANLFGLKVLRRVGRYKRLKVDMSVLIALANAASVGVPDRNGTPPAGGADKLAPRRGTHVCPSPNSIYVPNKKMSDHSVFTQKQVVTIRRVMIESSELLGRDADALPVDEHWIATIGLQPGTTYAEALKIVTEGGTSQQAVQLTAAVLALRADPRVQGTEL